MLFIGWCIVLLVAAVCACAQSPIYNPSFEDDLMGWGTYSYSPLPQGSPMEPWTGCIGTDTDDGDFDLLMPTPPTAPDGDYVCGLQSQNTSSNGGIYQNFNWFGGPAVISVTARAFSASFPGNEPCNNGCRVRMALLNTVSGDRDDVPADGWVEFPWGDFWSVKTLSVPGPGVYTLFIEAYQPYAYGTTSTLWDNVVFTPLAPSNIISGPSVTIPGDPTRPDKTALISWTTDQPTTSWVDYGSTTSYGRVAQCADLVTQHAVMLSSLTNSSSYHFQVSSTSPTCTPCTSADSTFTTPIQISNISSSYIVNGTDVIVNWTTDIPTTSQIEYGTTTAYGSATSPSPNLSQDHQLTLTGLAEDTTYHFRIWATNLPYYTVVASEDQVFDTLPNVSQTLQNGGFESSHNGVSPSLYPWVQYTTVIPGLAANPIDGIVGPFPAGGQSFWPPFDSYYGSPEITAFDGSYFLGAAANGSYENGGVFQRIQATPGQTCTLVAHFATCRSLNIMGTDNMAMLGIDPNGGADPQSPDVQWNSVYSATNDNQWQSATISATAGNNGSITVFLGVFQQWSAWHVVAIDGVSLGAPVPMSVGQLKQSSSGGAAILQNKVVTYVDDNFVYYGGNTYVKAYVEDDNAYGGRSRAD